MKHFNLRDMAVWLILAAFFFPVPVAQAHEAQSGMVYEAYCCNGDANIGDCQEIPASRVKAVEGGYQVTLFPGDHRKITESQQWIKPYPDVRPSTDGKFHACLWPSEKQLRCLYAPAQGF